VLKQSPLPIWIIEVTNKNKVTHIDLRKLFTNQSSFDSTFIDVKLKYNGAPIYNSEFSRIKKLIRTLVLQSFDLAMECIANDPESNLLYNQETDYLYLDYFEIVAYTKLNEKIYSEIEICLEIYGKNGDPVYLYDSRGIVTILYRVDDLENVLSYEIVD
jgi:hypothetical protein